MVTNRPEIVKYLLDSGAHVLETDMHGKTPVHYAIQMNLDECTLLLRAYAARSPRSVRHMGGDFIFLLHFNNGFPSLFVVTQSNTSTSLSHSRILNLHYVLPPLLTSLQAVCSHDAAELGV